MKGIIGLFPGLSHIGGIQASGLAAWEGILSQSSDGVQKHLFCYEKGNSQAAKPFPGIYTSTKLQSVRAAWQHKGILDTALFWHIDLLKLLPFLRFKDLRKVLFLHGVEVWRKPDAITQRLLQRVDLFLYNSQHTWERFLEFHPQFAGARHKHIALGLGEAITEPAAAPSDPPAALMIGRCARNEDYKGHREVIEAWPLVRQQVSEAQLWIVGTGDLQPVLESRVQHLNLTGAVRFWGKVTEAKKVELLQAARCLALPSQGEGFGLVYLEAMRWGRPCLVSGLDAGHEVVQPPLGGLAANPKHPNELVAALARLLSDTEEWREWSQQARRIYEQYFTASHFQHRLVQALQEL